jgi:hypothetical protein
VARQDILRSLHGSIQIPGDLEEETAPHVSLIGALSGARQSSSCAAKRDIIHKNGARVKLRKKWFRLYSRRGALFDDLPD